MLKEWFYRFQDTHLSTRGRSTCTKPIQYRVFPSGSTGRYLLPELVASTYNFLRPQCSVSNAQHICVLYRSMLNMNLANEYCHKSAYATYNKQRMQLETGQWMQGLSRSLLQKQVLLLVSYSEFGKDTSVFRPVPACSPHHLCLSIYTLCCGSH